MYIVPITNWHHELVFYKLAAVCVYCIILYITLWSRRFRERLRVFILFTVIITIHRLFCRFDRRNPRPWRVRKYVRGGEPPTIIITNRALVSGSPRHVVTIFINIYEEFTYCVLSGKLYVIITYLPVECVPIYNIL